MTFTRAKKIALIVMIDLWLWWGIFWTVCWFRNLLDRP